MSRPRRRAAPADWFRRWFDDAAYELVYARRDGAEARQALDLVERLAQPKPGAEILDVGCGRGRHSLALARRGYRVTGLDLAPRALDAARQRVAGAGLSGRARFVQADMRAIPFRDAFDGAVNLFTSFGFFDEEADHGRVLAGVARAVRTGGWVVQDFLNAPAVVAALVPRDERTIQRHTGEGAQRLHVRQERWLADGPGGLRVRKQITLTAPSGAVQTFDESVRLLTRADLERLYAESGLAVEQVCGDYDGRPHTDQSPRLILLARRPLSVPEHGPRGPVP